MTPSDSPAEIVDRVQPLREVNALIDAARAQDAAAVIRIAGPAGIGKTTFLRYVLANRPLQGRTLWARAEPSERTGHAAAVRALLGTAAEPDAGEGALRAALDAAVAAGATIVLDDAQWLDEISERLLRGVIRRHGASVTVLFTDRRESSAELQPHRTVRLRPLARASAAALVNRWYPYAAPDVVDEIVTAGSGLPFSIEFMAAAAAERAASSPDEIGASPAAVIAERLDRSAPLARELILHCSFLDAPADLRHVARALGVSVELAADALAELGDLATVDAALRVRFRHASIAEACMAATAKPVSYYRRLLAAFSAAEDRVETLASMLHCALGCGDDETAAACALRLGRRFAATGSLVTALEHVGIALQHAPRPLPTTYAVEYASALMQLARDTDAASFLSTELRGAIARGDGAAIAELMTCYSSVALSLEHFVEFDALFERVVPIVQANAPQALAMLFTARLAALAFAGNLAEAEGFAAAVGTRWADQRALAFTAALSGRQQLADDRFEAYRAGLGIAHARLTQGDRALLATIGMHAIGNAALRGIDDGWGDERDRGTYPTGTALRILRRIGDGCWREAGAIVEHLPLDDPEMAEPYALLDARLLLSGIARRTPHASERALRALRAMVADGRRRHAVAAACWYWIACAHGSERVPPDLVAFVTENLHVQPMPYLVGGIPLAVALLAPELGADRCAAALARRTPAASRWDRAHASLADGILRGDAATLRRARDAFDALGAPVFATIAGLALPIPRAADAALARELGMLPANESAPAGPAKLTKREGEICELAAQGFSNREIALRTGLKERTVETHLTAAFRKIGVRSRSALAHALLRLVGRDA